MKKLFAMLLVLTLVLSSVAALAEWPERAIELIVPANPGGDTDANARALAAALTEEMGWNVIVSNMSGGSGAVAFEDLLGNPDDGYRFVFYHSGACITQMLGMYESFNVLDDSSWPACRFWTTPTPSSSTAPTPTSPIWLRWLNI